MRLVNILVTAAVFAVLTGAAQGQTSFATLAGSAHYSAERGPLRKADLSPASAPVSSEVLAGPDSKLDSAWILYTRIAAGAGAKAGLFTLPADHTYLVLSGKMNVQLGSDNFVAEPETLVLAPAGTPHRVWNTGSVQTVVFEVIAAPPPMAPLASLYKAAQPKKLENPASYVRPAPKLGQLAGGTGHESLNERVLADRDTGSQHVLERLNDVLPGGGRTEPHMHPFDQVYFVRAGTMAVQYGMLNVEAGANTLVVLPMGVVHNNGNKGTGPQSIITLLLPQPEKGQPMGSGVLQIQGRGGQ